MFCNHCGQGNLDGSSFCPKCGEKLGSGAAKGLDSAKVYTIDIFRESQTFLLNSPINISIDGRKSCSIANGERLELQLSEGQHELVFSQSMRKKSLTVDLQEDICINLKWNRIWGSIEATIS